MRTTVKRVAFGASNLRVRAPAHAQNRHLAVIWGLPFNGSGILSTQFFERQEVQRKYTRWLIAGFIAAILLVVVVINLVVLIGLGGNPMHVMKHEPAFVFWTSLVVLVTIGLGCWHKASELRSGGASVARSLGGIPIASDDPDLARKRLVNIVEEMAIAARIRKPQIFVLPDEEAINAFAAGHSPDEAAVAVTQGALDRLDRDQLQAVVGHEFSHILNGDMQLNMRLTAWLFGLYVITSLAQRVMRGRTRGKKDVRLWFMAFGIFAAGSVGMFAGRLLQAAVSRRREQLADASAIQFTRNPGALQGAFIAMAAHSSGTKLTHENATGVSHMFIAASDPKWANKIGGSWFATHPPIEERVRAIDHRVTPNKFRSLVSDERRKQNARAAQLAAEAAPPPAPVASKAAVAAVLAPAFAPGELDMAALDLPVMAAAATASPAPAAIPAATDTGATSGSRRTLSVPGMALAETMPTGVRQVDGRSLPPDVLRNRLSQDQQNAITAFVTQVERFPIAVQATFVATMLAPEPAKWRTQLTRLAPLLGIELFKETQAQIARLAELAPSSRLPLLNDLLPLLDSLEPAHRKRLRAVARAFGSTVSTGDMLRFSVTRVLEKKLRKAVVEPPPVPLPECAAAVCELYSALAQCRFGAGKQGQNSYRAGVMGMLTPQKWAPYPETLITPAQLDAALAAATGIHPTGKRSFSEGLARVIAVGGRLTVPQVDLLRGICLIVDCALPLIPVDVVYEENDVAPRSQASAR
jgi:Zn-dependent protease with chaperone function